MLQSEEFDLTVLQGAATFSYPGLSMTSGHPRYYATIINGDTTGPITAKPYDPPNTTALPDNRPLQTNPQALNPGQNFDASAIHAGDYEKALALLEGIRDINIVATPDRTDIAVQRAVQTHCTNLFDRVAIFDAVRVNLQQPKATSLQTVINQSLALGDTKGFGALYFPWLSVTSLNTGQPLMVPPSGYVAGIYARTDATRGVFKAPAGVGCTVSGALGVDLGLSDNDQGVVNLKGVNVIRVFQSSGAPVVWGARTISQDTNWQYVNIRRLFLFLEQSIQIGIRNSVFEPNNPALWQSLKRTISAFLTQQWRGGALFGVKASDAFYVRIDDVLNPPSERQLGRLTIEIGVQPAYPAEFIIVRIGIWDGGSDITES
jgi:phage tail sheath protein FI